MERNVTVELITTLNRVQKGNVVNRVCLSFCSQGDPCVITGHMESPGMFTLVHFWPLPRSRPTTLTTGGPRPPWQQPPTHMETSGPIPQELKLVHYVTHTTVRKRVASPQLKGMLVRCSCMHWSVHCEFTLLQKIHDQGNETVDRFYFICLATAKVKFNSRYWVHCQWLYYPLRVSKIKIENWKWQIGTDINRVTFGKFLTSLVQKLKILGVYTNCESRYLLQMSFYIIS